MKVLYGNDAFSILVLDLKRVLQFFEKGFRFPENYFKLKVLKTSNISTDCHIKTCRSRKRRAILKIPSTVFEKNLCSFRWLKKETFEKKHFSLLRQKPTQILP